MYVWGNITSVFDKIVQCIDEGTLRRAGLVLRRVTICGYTVLVFNQAVQVNSARPSFRG